MHLNFVKVVQFTRLLKAGDRQREFNFKKLKNLNPEIFTVNVCDERGDRIFFNMEKKDNDWKIVPGRLPQWIVQNETGLNQLIEEELSGNTEPTYPNY
jgi:hypothetical protein